MKKILLITSCVLLVAACIAGPVFAGGKKEEAAEQKGEMTAPEQKPAGGFSWKQQEGAKLRLMFVQHYFTDSRKWAAYVAEHWPDLDPEEQRTFLLKLQGKMLGLDMKASCL